MSTTAAGILPHQQLRAATRVAHEEVDGAFARFDLSDAASYGAFLDAHARVLPAIEATLAGFPGLPLFVPRAPALRNDLAALGQLMPQSSPVPRPSSDAAAWGMLYVIEGSRLGGVMLARQVPDALPRSYLSAAHPHGDWRALLADYDDAARSGGDVWANEATAAARGVFTLYRESAEAAGGDQD